MASKTVNENSVLLTVTQEDILALLLLDHRHGGVWPGAHQPPGDTENVQRPPPGGACPLHLLLHHQQRLVSTESPAQHQGQQNNKNSGHEQQNPLYHLHQGAALLSSLVLLSSLASKPSTPGPHTSSVNLHCPRMKHNSAQLSTHFPHLIHMPGPAPALPSRSLPLSASGSHWSPSLSIPWFLPWHLIVWGWGIHIISVFPVHGRVSQGLLPSLVFLILPIAFSELPSIGLQYPETDF